MKNVLGKAVLPSLLALGVWLFWWLAHPEAIGFQEQNQLFLFSWDYLGERLSLAGGLADWISEFFVQFCYVPWLGALMLALLFVLLYLLAGGLLAPLSVLVLMGDIYVLPAFLVALIMGVAACRLYEKCSRKVLFAVLTVPVLYWLAGPVVLLFALYVLARDLRSGTVAIVWSVIVILVLHHTVLTQYPPKQIWLGINYYRMPLQQPFFMVLVAFLVMATPLLTRIFQKGANIEFFTLAQSVVLAGLAVLGVFLSYDKDTYEIIAYDQLVRAEKWDAVVKRAEKYQPKSDIGCVSVNLSLYMTGRFDELLNFYQCGTQGLLMPRVRDLISNISTYEAFWRLGMVNSALRYAFDSQESEMNNRKSGRHSCRMVEAYIVNGRYDVASKHIDRLKQSLFYRKWAIEQEGYLYNEQRIEANPVYKYLRVVRFQNDFLYYYPEMEKMLLILYNQNKNNHMAASYAMAWRRLSQGGEQ